MENKMTAVEWLEYMWINGEHYSIESVMEWFEKAKQMEKEQIIKAAERWKGTNFAEQYYNETYGK